METSTLSQQVDCAKRHVSEAEKALDKLMREIDEEPRHQKVTVSRVMQDAFEKLRAAKADVVELEKLLASED